MHNNFLMSVKFGTSWGSLKNFQNLTTGMIFSKMVSNLSVLEGIFETKFQNPGISRREVGLASFQIKKVMRLVGSVKIAFFMNNHNYSDYLLTFYNIFIFPKLFPFYNEKLLVFLYLFSLSSYFYIIRIDFLFGQRSNLMLFFYLFKRFFMIHHKRVTKLWVNIVNTQNILCSLKN